MRRYSRLLALLALAPLLMSVQNSGPADQSLPVVGADVVDWDVSQGTATACEQASLFRQVSLWWYLPLPDGSVVRRPEATGIDNDVVSRLRACGLRIIPTIANFSSKWDDATVRSILRSPALRDQHIAALAGLVETNNFDGLDIDYESLHREDATLFTAFVSSLAAVLHAGGKTLMISVHPPREPTNDPVAFGHDYVSLARSADQIRVMAYDLHWSASGPGPISPANWVKSVLDYMKTHLPEQKAVLGLGLYGYDWSEDGSEGRDLTWQEVQNVRTTTGAEVKVDPISLSPYFEYLQDGLKHIVWFENAESIAAKLDLAVQYRTSAYFWRLGGEDPLVWPAVRARFVAS